MDSILFDPHRNFTIFAFTRFFYNCLTERKESLFCKRSLCPTLRRNLFRADEAKSLTVQAKEWVGSKVNTGLCVEAVQTYRLC
jgi:hypothetical protein